VICVNCAKGADMKTLMLMDGVSDTLFKIKDIVTVEDWEGQVRQLHKRCSDHPQEYSRCSCLHR